MVLACFASIALGANAAECRFAKKETIHKLPGNFALHLTPLNDSAGDGCRATLIDSQKKTVFSVVEWDLQLVLSGKDVNGDGTPDIVLEGFSGGAHCCWTYYIVSLGPNPGLLFKFENEQGAEFKANASTGRIEVYVRDGAFDYFESAHAFSPFPDVYLRLDRTHLVDISGEHLADYDQKIKRLKIEIPDKDLKVFLQAENQDEKVGWEQVSTRVLEIVLAYLYSGRQEQAHTTLKKMWPAFDQERIWKLILETRQKGILRYTQPNTSQPNESLNASSSPPRAG